MRFNDYVLNIKQINFIQKYMVRSPKIIGMEYTLEDFLKLSYRSLKITIPELLNGKMYEEIIHEVIKSKKKCTFKRVKRLNNKTKLYFLFHIIDTVKQINEIERLTLSSPPKADLIAAGINELDKVGEVSIKQKLSHRQIWRWKDIEQMKYEDVYMWLLDDHIWSKIKDRLNENQKNK